MKLNREQLAAVLAVLILIVGAREILLGVLAPTGHVLPVDPELTRSQREVVPRTYRSFTREGEMLRNPFVFSEGWEPLDVLPMAVPPLPPAPRPVPALLQAAPVLDARVRFVEKPVSGATPAERGSEDTAGKTAEEDG